MLRGTGYKSASSEPASSEPASEEAIVMDEWGLIPVTWRQAAPGVHAWWRTGDDAQKSFLEIGLDPDSGALCSLALGHPLCDLRRWEGGNFLTDPFPSSVATAGRTRFGLDVRGGLVLVEVVALFAQERRTLCQYHTVIGWAE